MNGLFIGATSIDLIYPLDSFPEEDTKNYSESQIIDVGGPATNAAFAFAALGGKATLASLVGDNPFSSFVRRKLMELEVDHIDINIGERTNPPLSSILINRQTGSRTISCTRPPVPGVVKLSGQLPLDYDIICVDGFFAEFSLQILAQNQGSKPVVLDGGSYKLGTDQILDSVSYPIFSEHFRFPNSPVETVMAQKGINTFAVTHGAEPIRVNNNGKVYSLPIAQVQVLDTLGAGDIFHGAFCYYILQEDFETALSQASVIAGLSCQFSGTREWAKHV